MLKETKKFKSLVDEFNKRAPQGIKMGEFESSYFVQKIIYKEKKPGFFSKNIPIDNNLYGWSKKRLREAGLLDVFIEAANNCDEEVELVDDLE